MLDRVLDVSFYLMERAWAICATLLVIAAIGLASAIMAPEPHPERVLVRIG